MHANLKTNNYMKKLISYFESTSVKKTNRTSFIFWFTKIKEITQKKNKCQLYYACTSYNLGTKF